MPLNMWQRLKKIFLFPFKLTIWQWFYKIFRSSFGIVSVIMVIGLWSTFSYYAISYINGPAEVASDDYSDVSATGTSDTEGCNVVGINLHGDIVTYHTNDSYNDQGSLLFDQTSADEVDWAVGKAKDNPDIKAIIVDIDSYGGSGVAGEEMMRAFKESKKPVVAFIRDAGLSAAYLAATGAQTIFASKFSDVGSIGVTRSYLQETEKNKKDGLTYIDLSSGLYKDSGNPSRPLTETEKQLFMRDIKIGYEYFVNIVSQNRNLSNEKVRALGDGSSMMGEQALKEGLIDKIGLLPDAVNYLTEKIGEEVEVCWY